MRANVIFMAVSLFSAVLLNRVVMHRRCLIFLSKSLDEIALIVEVL